jgi:hypothetical protein
MLASAPWYTSATAIGWLAIVVAALCGVTTIALWRLGIPRRTLVYLVDSESLLLNSNTAPAPISDIKVTAGDRKVDDPYLTTLVISSRSRRDIRASDFDEGKALVFNFGVPIAARPGIQFRNGQNQPALRDTSSLEQPVQSIEILPSLVRKGRWCRITVLSEGRPTITYESPIADVTVRRLTGEFPRNAFVLFLIQAGCLIGAGALIAQQHLNALRLLLGVVLVGIAAFIGGFLASRLRQRL